jgi:Fe-S cluster assembly iron-binding protein IscA
LRLKLSESAAGELKTLFDRLPEPRPRLRVFIDNHCHCGNVHFNTKLEDQISGQDAIFAVQGVGFVSDPETTPELGAVEIDYTRDLDAPGLRDTQPQPGLRWPLIRNKAVGPPVCEQSGLSGPGAVSELRVR